MLRTVGGRSENGKSNKRQLAEKIWEMALAGNIAAARLIYEYCDGKPTQHLEHTGLEGNPIVTSNTIIVREYLSDEGD